MLYRCTIALLAVATVLTAADVGQAQDKKYPNWKGEWEAISPRMPGQRLRFDPTRPYGRGQQAPLTEEYKKIYEANLAEQAAGGQGLFLDHASCGAELQKIVIEAVSVPEALRARARSFKVTGN